MSNESRNEDRELELDEAGLLAVAEASATPPPPELRARVMAEVRRSADAEQLESRLRRWRVAGGTALAACAALAALMLLDSRESGNATEVVRALEQERIELNAQLEEQREEFALLEDALTVQSEVMRILSARRLITASLGASGGGSGNARVLLDPASGAVAVIGSGLPPPQTGKVYELWAIRADGSPERAGTLAPTEDRSFAVRLRHMESPADFTEFAISLEPRGGAERPTGPFVLAGTVER